MLRGATFVDLPEAKTNSKTSQNNEKISKTWREEEGETTVVPPSSKAKTDADDNDSKHFGLCKEHFLLICKLICDAGVDLNKRILISDATQKQLSLDDTADSAGSGKACRYGDQCRDQRDKDHVCKYSHPKPGKLELKHRSGAAKSSESDRPRDPKQLQHDLGYTVLHMAVATGNADLVRFWLDQGANPMVSDEAGMTPLMQAAHERSAVEIPTLLLKLGRHNKFLVHAVDSAKRTALHYAVNFWPNTRKTAVAATNKLFKSKRCCWNTVRTSIRKTQQIAHRCIMCLFHWAKRTQQAKATPSSCSATCVLLARHPYVPDRPVSLLKSKSNWTRPMCTDVLQYITRQCWVLRFAPNI